MLYTHQQGVSIFAQQPSKLTATADLLSYTLTGELYDVSGSESLKLELPLFHIKGVYKDGRPLRIAVLCCVSTARQHNRFGTVI